MPTSAGCLQALRDEGLAERTLVFFTSDNGPWLTQEGARGLGRLAERRQGEHVGGRHARAGNRLDAGQRFPPAPYRSELASTLDLLPTACKLAGIEPPADRPLDGYEITAAARRRQKSAERDVLLSRL